MFDTPAPIRALTADLAEVNRRWAAIVERLIETRAAVAWESGLSMAVWLSAVSKLPKDERTRLQVAADVLPSLPQVRARFVDGAVAWPVVSRICTKSVRLSPDELAIVDARMAQAIDHLAGDCTADAILDVLWELLAQLRASRERDRERRLERGEFLALQPFLDGSGGSLYGELGAVNFAAVSDAVCDAAPMPEVAPNPMGDPQVTADNRRSIAQARAAGLVELCSPGPDGKPARLTAIPARHAGRERAAREVADGSLKADPRPPRADGQGRPEVTPESHAASTCGPSHRRGWTAAPAPAGMAARGHPRLPRDLHVPGLQPPGPGLRHRPRRRVPRPRTHQRRQPQSRPPRPTRREDRPRLDRSRRRRPVHHLDNRTGVSVTQPSLWAIKALATGTHPANRERQPA